MAMRTSLSSLLALFVLLCGVLAAVAMGSAVNKNDLWDPRHIDDLPAEIRQYIAAICKGPASALNDFVTYSPQEKRWRINLEYLRRDGLREYRRGSRCLDVDFIAIGSRFGLARKHYAGCDF